MFLLGWQCHLATRYALRFKVGISLMVRFREQVRFGGLLPVDDRPPLDPRKIQAVNKLLGIRRPYWRKQSAARPAIRPVNSQVEIVIIVHPSLLTTSINTNNS